jgi:hypothetical protein
MLAGGAVDQESIAQCRSTGGPTPRFRRRTCFVTANVLAFFLVLGSGDAQGARRAKAQPRPRAAQAQKNAPNNAESLLADGKKLLASRQYAAACAKIQESQRLAPASSKLLELAICHEKQGKTATAWRELNAVLRQGVGTDASSKTARAHLTALEPRISRITITARQGTDTAAIQLTIDGVPLEDSAWGTPMPVDPGSHSVVATVGGAQQWSSRIDVGAGGDQKTVEVPVLAKASSTSPQSAPKPEPTVNVTEKLEQPSFAETPPDDHEQQRSNPHRPVMGYVLLGAGLVGIGVGSYFGVRAISLRSDSDDICRLRGCTQEAVSLNNDAKTAAWGSNIGIGVGALALGIGGYLLLKPLSPARNEKTEPESKADSASIWFAPQIAPTNAGATFGGAW